MARDDRGILINRGDPLRLPLLFVAQGDPAHRPGLNILQALDRTAAGHDETSLLLPRWPEGCEFLVVKTLEKSAQGRRLGRAIAQPPSRHTSPLSSRISSGQSPPTTCRRLIDSIIWDSVKPRWRWRSWRLAATKSGSPKER